MSSAWLFPGQGSQVVGMGRDVHDQYPAAREVFATADRVLGFALSRIIFEGPADQLTATENAQPAILTTSVAMLAAAGWTGERSGYGEAPAFVAGHSLGEYSALVAAGALTFETALLLVRQRGELMAAATEGTMAAVLGLAMDKLQAVCDEAQALGPVVIANENAPGQLVISGAREAVARAGELAKSAGAARVIPLKVSAAFHSPLMQTAAEGLRDAVMQADVRPATIPLIANVSALPISEPDAIKAELIQQVTAPVRWIGSVQYMAEAGVKRFVEWGPGTVLAGMIKRTTPEIPCVSVGSVESLNKL